MSFRSRTGSNERKELKLIESDINALLQESKEQHGMLEDNKLYGRSDMIFVQPMLEYSALMSIYDKLLTSLGNKELKSYYSERGLISDKQKENVEKLSYSELLHSAQDTYNELAALFPMKTEEKKKELGKVLFFTLEHGAGLLQGKFKILETLMARVEKKIAAERMERQKKRQALDEEIATQRAEKEKEARRRQEAEKGKQEAEQKAETLAEALRKAGIDPDTILQSTRVSHCASESQGTSEGRRASGRD